MGYNESRQAVQTTESEARKRELKINKDNTKHLKIDRKDGPSNREGED